MNNVHRVGAIVGLCVTSTLVCADISFEDVSQDAGISFSGPTVGASWGELNGDGYPDLFVANHRLEGNTCSLYLNRGNGTFTDVASTALEVSPSADLHGAAWGDFDNDGDQDLVSVAGGGAGTGESEGQWSFSNHLFINEGGTLRNEAAQLGLGYPRGRGRTPLWFDADLDGALDVLFMNFVRPDGQAPSAVFCQSKDRFEKCSERLGFRDAKWTRQERVRNLINNALRMRLKRNPSFLKTGNCRFAQLADVSDDGVLDLVTYAQNFRVYSLTPLRLEEITSSIVFPSQRFVQDIAIEDFDGDGRNDIYVVRSRSGRWWSNRVSPKPVVQTTPYTIQGTLPTGSQYGDKTIRFRTDDAVTFQLYPQWVPGNSASIGPKVRVGSREVPNDQLSWTLSPEDAIVVAEADQAPVNTDEVSITYHPPSHTWILRSSDEQIGRINFTVESNKPIDQVRMWGFESEAGELPDVLLLRREDEFVSKGLSGRAALPTACHSVVAGDFDNDMDIDLYLVCAGVVENHPNRLYENDGKGDFRMVQDAGGAAGSNTGRGDAVVVADYDRDGFLDLFVTNGTGPAPFGYDGPHQLFHNKGNHNHWLEIDLEGVVSNRDGIGASLELQSGGVVQIRGQGAGMHCYSQNHQRIHFGLGPNKNVDKLTIRWPSGIVQEMNDIDADQLLIVREPNV